MMGSADTTAEHVKAEAIKETLHQIGLWLVNMERVPPGGVSFVLTRLASLLNRTYVPVELIYPVELTSTVARIRDQHQAAMGAAMSELINAWARMWQLEQLAKSDTDCSTKQ